MEEVIIDHKMLRQGNESAVIDKKLNTHLRKGGVRREDAPKSRGDRDTRNDD